MQRNSSVRSTTLFLAALLLLIQTSVFASTSWATAELSRADPMAVSAVLGPLRSLSDLSAYLMTEPDTCVSAVKGKQICAWTVNSNQAAWGKLAPLLETSGNLTVLCQVPLKDRSRKKGSCSIHENKSAKDIWEPAADKWAEKNRGVGGGFFAGGERRQARGERAAELIAQAQTALGVSRLVGAAPTSCTGIGKVRTCVWKATKSVQGFALLADWLDTSKKIRLWCDLPEDGSARAADSCRGEVGD